MKARRKEIGLSAEQVAAALDISPATIYRYERGDIEKMPGDRLPLLAKVLQTTPAYLMGWSGPETIENLPPISPATPVLQALAESVAQLNDEGQEKLVEYADDLVSSGKYKKYCPLELDQEA